jgi:putative FmdB family regulatory protein
MPIYEYKCVECGYVLEEMNSMSVDRVQCSECDNVSMRIISLSTFRLNGGGWYKDGYEKKVK